ncbi:SRPBCC domain-containing protein, partial [Acinetobacter baumannii]|uniref:SRPBCC domain-containing protein n=1 Tax=Acinetobacter baumannii TaxID=470 RepID=UPI00148F9110|nr:ATPase [Acinetobacter baumannii]
METTPEQLWDALTSTTFTRQYWFDTELQSDWKVGSPLALVMSGKTTDTGEILEADRPRRLS